MGRIRRGLATIPLLTAALLSSPSVQGTAPSHPVIVSLNPNQSSNWGGYNQGAIAKGTLFNSITGNWTVPTASQHKSKQEEYSSAWIGIGGGCPESTCNVPSFTLIQLGTEQDVNAKGKASYSAWWELIPAPGVTIDSLRIHPGDRMRGSISEVAPGSNIWTMSLTDLTTGQSWSQTVPYSSTHDTAEWILETPLVFGTGGAQIAAMPNLSTVRFDRARVNGANPALARAEEIQLVTEDGRPVATPSAPDAQRDGFNVCTYRASCPKPGTSGTASTATKKRTRR
jgi:Peptidase A4 family